MTSPLNLHIERKTNPILIQLNTILNSNNNNNNNNDNSNNNNNNNNNNNK